MSCADSVKTFLLKRKREVEEGKVDKTLRQTLVHTISLARHFGARSSSGIWFLIRTITFISQTIIALQVTQCAGVFPSHVYD